MSSSPPDVKLHTFGEVKLGLLEGRLLLLDVRSKAERLDPGRIPGSKHLDINDLDRALSSYDRAAFVKEFDFAMPDEEDGEKKKAVLVYGASEGQAREAVQKLGKLGWPGTGMYADALSDWKSKGGLVLSGDWSLVNYEWVSGALKKQREGKAGDFVLVDVRNKKERAEPGYIAGSKHIPLPEILDAFTRQNPWSFSSKYGFERPSPSSCHVVTHCKSGKRARDAADALALAGYSRVSVYAGSFDDWAKRGGEVHKEG